MFSLQFGTLSGCTCNEVEMFWVPPQFRNGTNTSYQILPCGVIHSNAIINRYIVGQGLRHSRWANAKMTFRTNMPPFRVQTKQRALKWINTCFSIVTYQWLLYNSEQPIASFS